MKLISHYRLVEQFTNEDVEALKDKKDKIQSKLFCKLIMSLAEVMPDNRRGHYSSLATLFKCSKCGKSIIQSVSNYVPCIASAMIIDNHGYVRSKHIRYSYKVQIYYYNTYNYNKSYVI